MKEDIEKKFRKFMTSSKGCISIDKAKKELNKKYPNKKPSAESH